MNIFVKVVPHSAQRYRTVGDWFWDGNGTLQIRVSKMNNWRYECLIAVHELVEVLICKHCRISQSAVDKFDMMYENEREEGLHSDTEEPGDDPLCPYRKQHRISTIIEELVAFELGVEWDDYDELVNSL